jgi:hypothetical protein
LIKYALLVELRQNLATNKADYGKMIRETEAFSPEAEAILKETLIELTS